MPPLLTDQREFDDLCGHIQHMREVAFDTEFVSEHTYRPQLCLLQFATRERCVAVDPFQVTQLAGWWELMVDPSVTVVVHGGREEVRFCMHAAGRRPERLVDVQVAEGLRSPSFPLGYTQLVGRVAGKRVHGKETRTDWRRRPLSDAQTKYALEDVEHLLPIWDRQRAELVHRKRLAWAEAEFARLVDEVDEGLTREGWRRLPGVQRLNARELAVLRELHAWREEAAAQLDKPVRRMLRDDLLLEMAQRQPQTVADVTASRDMNRSDYRRVAPDIIAAIARGLAVSNHDCPRLEKQEKREEEHVLGQILAIALANRCLQEEVAVQLVGTAADLRHLVRWHVYGDRSGPPPRLTTGWRAEVCGNLLTDVLDGRITLRVADPQSEHPLIFEERMTS